MATSSAERAAETMRVRTRRIRYLAAPAFALILAACGGSAEVESTAAADAGVEEIDATALAEDAAATNAPNLQSAESVFDVEVLTVADGSVASLRDVVTGDRPVLVWFYAPH